MCVVTNLRLLIHFIDLCYSFIEVFLIILLLHLYDMLLEVLKLLVGRCLSAVLSQHNHQLHALHERINKTYSFFPLVHCPH